MNRRKRSHRIAGLFAHRFQMVRKGLMDQSAMIPIWVSVTMILLLVTGCHSLNRLAPQGRFATSPRTPQKASGSVPRDPVVVKPTETRIAVGGQVRVPQQIDFHSKLTLGSVLALSGGLPPNANAAVMLVRLSKGHGIQKQSVFIPYHFATDSLASEIRVSPGDEVLVVAASSTPLNHEVHEARTNRIVSGTTQASNQNSFAIAGMVTMPGRYQPTDFQKPVLRWRELFLSAMIQQQADLAIVMRPPATGVGKVDVFLLPLAMPFNKKQDSLNGLPNSQHQSGFARRSAIESSSLSVSRVSTRPTFDDVLVVDQHLRAPEPEQSLPSVLDMFIVPGDRVVFTRATTVPMITQGLTAPIYEAIESAFDHAKRDRKIGN